MVRRIRWRGAAVLAASSLFLAFREPKQRETGRNSVFSRSHAPGPLGSRWKVPEWTWHNLDRLATHRHGCWLVMACLHVFTSKVQMEQSLARCAERRCNLDLGSLIRMISMVGIWIHRSGMRLGMDHALRSEWWAWPLPRRQQ